jgi:hypothetical protein
MFVQSFFLAFKTVNGYVQATTVVTKVFSGDPGKYAGEFNELFAQTLKDTTEKAQANGIEDKIYVDSVTVLKEWRY